MEKKKKKRGFAAMDPEAQRALASRGGTKAHKIGHAREWTLEEARAAGRKGGEISKRKRKAATVDTAT